MWALKVKAEGISKNYSLTISPSPVHFTLTAVNGLGLVFHFSFDLHCASSNSFFLHVWQMKSHTHLKGKVLSSVGYREAWTPSPSRVGLMWPYGSDCFITCSAYLCQVKYPIHTIFAMSGTLMSTDNISHHFFLALKVTEGFCIARPTSHEVCDKKA